MGILGIIGLAILAIAILAFAGLASILPLAQAFSGVLGVIFNWWMVWAPILLLGLIAYIARGGSSKRNSGRSGGMSESGAGLLGAAAGIADGVLSDRSKEDPGSSPDAPGSNPGVGNPASDGAGPAVDPGNPSTSGDSPESLRDPAEASGPGSSSPDSKPSLPSGGDSNLNRERDNGNMADNVEQEMHNLFSLVREEEQLDGEEMEHLKQAEKDAKRFLEDYEQYKGHIKLLKNKVNGNISEAEYLNRMENLQLKGGEAGAPNKYAVLHDKLEEMKQLLEDLMQQLQTVEQLEQRALQDDQQAEGEVRSILKEAHLEDLERAIEQMSQ